MLPADFEDVLSCLPQALLRVGPDLRIQWIEPGFSTKTGLGVEPGVSLLSVLEYGRGRDALERAVREGRGHAGHLITCALKEVRIQARPARAGEAPGAWLMVEPSGVDDEAAFSQAAQDIARSVGETLDVDAVCSAAVVALVRCARVRRAEVFLGECSQSLRRAAVSDLADGNSPEDAFDPCADSLQVALATRQPQIGIQRGYGDALGSIFAAVPLCAPRGVVGLLLLYKEQGTSFSVKELELWSTAGAQLAVAVENARLLREAQAALEVREGFMTVASHELKTPLTPLKLSLSTMERRLAAGQSVELGSVLKSKQQVDRLLRLVSDLLDASRAEREWLALHPVPLEVGQLVAEVVDGFRRAVPRPFSVEVPRERVWVKGDRDRLEQVLVNLLENAHKYSPAGAPIHVEVEALAHETRIHVKDQGIGIPGADQTQLFQRFYRARNVSHRNFGGLGLGLYISQSIARRHGGSLGLKSVEGQGSTFTVELPRMPQREVGRLPRRVLLLDEDPGLESEAERVLRAEGFEVLTARDGAEALRKAAHLPVDLILLSASAQERQTGLFLESFATLPRARPVPILLAGPARPAWAHADSQLCARPYVPEELLLRVRNTLALEAEAPRPAGASSSEVPTELRASL